jgi:hypothetical protein
VDHDRKPREGLVETYKVAIAELESWGGPETATLLAALRALRDRAVGQSNARSSGFSLRR